MESGVPLWIVNRGVDATGSYLGFPTKICSNECKKWTPQECWDGYLRKRVWKMVCEENIIKCCPGYQGPNCSEECFNCDKINGFERRFIDIYSK
ncbi:hypothetical protein DPMN_015030, partial [Dreissena polymorpha]